VKRVKLWASAILYLLLGLALQTLGQAGAARYPESRSYSPGKVWLGWTSDERMGFVRGFITGHGDGYQSGCRAAETNSADSNLAGGDFDPCLQQRHLFRKDPKFYEQFITDFYNRYAMDRDVPFRVLLAQADEKTPEEVHRWLGTKSGQQ